MLPDHTRCALSVASNYLRIRKSKQISQHRELMKSPLVVQGESCMAGVSKVRDVKIIKKEMIKI